MSIFAPPTLKDTTRWHNKRIGLLGGSFNPPHAGHRHIAMAALKGLELDFVWWLVTPQNPIKAEKPLPLDKRMELCREIADHPRFLVSDIEAELGSQNTFESVEGLKRAFPSTDFIWISGMDNAHSLHKWNNWQGILERIPMVHITRSPAQSLVKACPVRMYSKQKHVFLNQSGRYSLEKGITYWMMQKKMVDISSTEIRNKSMV